MNLTRKDLHYRFNPRYKQPSPVHCKTFTRTALAALFGELGFTRGAEIGVQEGRYSEILLQNIPNLSLLLVDPWEEYQRPGMSGPSAEKQERIYESARRRVDGLAVKFLRMMSLEAAQEIPDNSLDFVYIDGNHTFDYVMQDLIAWSSKVKDGGIVAGHDYYHFRSGGVVYAVNAFTAAHGIREWFIDGEKEISYFWAK
jgi:hypothetical protein